MQGPDGAWMEIERWVVFSTRQDQLRRIGSRLRHPGGQCLYANFHSSTFPINLGRNFS